MTSRLTRRFRECFDRLPPDIQSQARRAYALFRDDPRPAARLERAAIGRDRQSNPGTPLTHAVGPSSHLLWVSRTTVRSERRTACSSP